MRLKAILSGEIPDDGDDHAGALGWSACFLACATEALERQKSKNCSACSGTGKTGEWNGIPAKWVLGNNPCPACKGTGKQRF